MSISLSKPKLEECPSQSRQPNSGEAFDAAQNDFAYSGSLRSPRRILETRE